MVIKYTDKYKIIGIGELLWDGLPAGRKMGGAPANFVFHCQQLGIKGTIVSSVGLDEAGDDLLKNLEDLDLSTAFIAKDANHRTGIVDVEIDEAGRPVYIIHENVAWDHIVFSRKLSILAQQTDAVCFGTLAQRSPVSRGTIENFLLDVRPRCLKFLDINLRQKYYSTELIKKNLAMANGLKMNMDEFAVISTMLSLKGTEQEKTNALIDMFNYRIVVLTRGEEGSSLYTGSDSSWMTAPKIDVADTVGAGDAFTAAIVSGLLKGQSLELMHKKATDLSAIVCQCEGATPLHSA